MKKLQSKSATRKLRLSTETVKNLSELRHVAGGATTDFFTVPCDLTYGTDVQPVK